MNGGRVIVLGSINLDIQLGVAALPLPGETARSLSVRRGLGGKGANQAVAASRAGASAALIGAVGEGGGIVQLIRHAAPDLDLGGVTTAPDCETGTAYILVAQDGENQIVTVDGANATLAGHGAAAIAPQDICLAQLEVPIPAIAQFFAAARALGARTVLNAAPALTEARALLDLVDVLIVNETELAQLSSGGDLAQDDIAGLAGAARSLCEGGPRTVIVTLGAKGLIVVGQDNGHLPARRVTPLDTTGAGDCFCGVFCAGLAAGHDIRTAAARANAAASLQVGRHGAADAMPWRDEIEAISGQPSGS